LRVHFSCLHHDHISLFLRVSRLRVANQPDGLVSLSPFILRASFISPAALAPYADHPNGCASWFLRPICTVVSLRLPPFEQPAIPTVEGLVTPTHRLHFLAYPHLSRFTPVYPNGGCNRSLSHPRGLVMLSVTSTLRCSLLRPLAGFTELVTPTSRMVSCDIPTVDAGPMVSRARDSSPSQYL
jgi:hypothetical protein